TLVDLVSLIRQGKRHLIGHLAAELRALMYWYEKKKTYNPLLLRLAGKFDLPLPIFFLKEENVPEIVSKANLHVRRGHASILKTFPTQRLADLQEWLGSTVLDLRVIKNTGGVSQSEHKALIAKDVILEMSTTLGTAHYDEDVPLLLEMLYQTRGPVADELTILLVEAATVVVELCDFVHERGREQPS